MTPYIISQCENHTIQERKCLPTFILAIIVNFNGFEETIADFQWFLRRPSPLNVFWRSDHCHQWFFDGFLFSYHRFQWFSMVPDHWSNDAMVSMDRSGLTSAHSPGQQLRLNTKILPGISRLPGERVNSRFLRCFNFATLSWFLPVCCQKGKNIFIPDFPT